MIKHTTSKSITHSSTPHHPNQPEALQSQAALTDYFKGMFPGRVLSVQPVGFDNNAHIKELEDKFKEEIEEESVEEDPYCYVQMKVCEGRERRSLWFWAMFIG